MIISREQLAIAGRCIIEKLVIQPPFRYTAVFDNEACFLFFEKGDVLMYGTDHITSLKGSGNMLLNCGHYFADLISSPGQDSMEIIAFHLYPDLLKEIFLADPELLFHAAKAKNDQTAYKLLMDHFIRGLQLFIEHKPFAGENLLKLKTKELILLLLQGNAGNSVADLISTLFTPRQAGIQSLMETHLFSNLHIDELAVLAGMSLSAFKRVFQSIYNDNPANYIRTKKLEKAKQLLLHSSLTVNEICYEAGFNDNAHFNRLFKKHFGQAPAKFRSTMTDSFH